jgi:hypothetical protein
MRLRVELKYLYHVAWFTLLPPQVELNLDGAAITSSGCTRTALHSRTGAVGHVGDARTEVNGSSKLVT